MHLWVSSGERLYKNYCMIQDSHKMVVICQMVVEDLFCKRNILTVPIFINLCNSKLDSIYSFLDNQCTYHSLIKKHSKKNCRKFFILTAFFFMIIPTTILSVVPHDLSCVSLFCGQFLLNYHT